MFSGLVKGALVIGGITQKTDGDFVASLELDGLGYPGCQRERAAHQRIAAHEMLAGIENVHGAAASLGRAGFLAIQFGHNLPGIRTALDGMNMITVAGDHIVITRAGRFHHAIAAGFLARVQMQEAADLAFDVSLIAAFFKTAVHHHFAEHAFFVFQFHVGPLSNEAGGLNKRAIIPKRACPFNVCTSTWNRSCHYRSLKRKLIFPKKI